MKWFYIDESIQEGDRRKGPVSFDDIHALRVEGKLSDTTLVWHSGLDNWILLKDAYIAEAQNKLEDDERTLKEAVDSLLKVKIEVEASKSYAGFFIRGFAFVIDNLAVFLISMMLFLLFEPLWAKIASVDLQAFQNALAPFSEQYMSGAIGFNTFNEKIAEIPGFSSLYTLFAGFLLTIQPIYFIFFNGFLSATPGKMLFRLRIETADGKRIGFLGASIRYICSLVTQMTLIYLWGIGYIIAAVDPQKRALHDFLARTRVVHIPRVFMTQPTNEPPAKENAPQDAKPKD